MFMRLWLWKKRRKLSPTEKAEAKKRHREFLRRHRTNDPLGFPVVDSTIGVPVGEALMVGHLALHDMAPHAIFCEMTFQVLVGGLRANAWRKINFEKTGDVIARTTIQPVWVDFIYHLSKTGVPLCGFTDKMSHEWPSVHRRVWDVSKCNCTGCHKAMNSGAIAA